MTAKNVLLVVMMSMIGLVAHAASDDFNDNEGTDYTGWTEVGGTNLYSEWDGRLQWKLGNNEIDHVTIYNTGSGTNDLDILHRRHMDF